MKATEALNQLINVEVKKGGGTKSILPHATRKGILTPHVRVYSSDKAPNLIFLVLIAKF